MFYFNRNKKTTLARDIRDGGSYAVDSPITGRPKQTFLEFESFYCQEKFLDQKFQLKNVLFTALSTAPMFHEVCGRSFIQFRVFIFEFILEFTLGLSGGRSEGHLMEAGSRVNIILII